MNFKKLLSVSMMAVLGMAVANAAGTEKSESATTDTSTNVLTGTKTTTKKHKSKDHPATGTASDATVVEKTKEHTDGTVEKTVEVDGKAKTPAKK